VQIDLTHKTAGPLVQLIVSSLLVWWIHYTGYIQALSSVSRLWNDSVSSRDLTSEEGSTNVVGDHHSAPIEQSVQSSSPNSSENSPTMNNAGDEPHAARPVSSSTQSPTYPDPNLDPDKTGSGIIYQGYMYGLERSAPLWPQFLELREDTG
jgi:hypothetical protein